MGKDVVDDGPMLDHSAEGHGLRLVRGQRSVGLHDPSSVIPRGTADWTRPVAVLEAAMAGQAVLEAHLAAQEPDVWTWWQQLPAAARADHTARLQDLVELSRAVVAELGP